MDIAHVERGLCREVNIKVNADMDSVFARTRRSGRRREMGVNGGSTVKIELWIKPYVNSLPRKSVKYLNSVFQCLYGVSP